MKKVKITVLVLLGVVLLLIIAGAIVKNNLLNRALPVYDGNQKITQLKSKVEVYRDSFAIPHIYANNETDLYLITGYITAQDRLWQMDLLRRVTSGRLSEIFGEKLVNTDILMRMLRIPEKSRYILTVTDSAVMNALEAYAKGVNLYIEEHKDKLPFEFTLLGYAPEQWKPEHSLSLIGYIAWDLNGSWNSEILLHQLANRLNEDQLNEFIPKTENQDVVIFAQNKNTDSWRNDLLATSDRLKELGLQVFHGSNNWAVSGSLTTTGKPILANDMHLGFGAPGIWYQIHQKVEGKVDVTGVLLPGQPFVVSGHNAKIAWGLTNVMNDDIDFYRETINPADSSKYKLDGVWKELEIRKEFIAVKDKDTVYKTIKFSHRGPIISELKGITNESISMRWVGNEMSNEVRSIYFLNRSANWDDFKHAMKTFVSVSQNVVFADTDGNIGLYTCAGIPVRNGFNPIQVLPGDTSLYDWKGLVPFEELPHVYNPANNIVISANNKTIGQNYPHYISYWFDLPYRYNRIKELIENDSTLSPQEMMVIQTDQVSDFARQYLPNLLNILSKQKLIDSREIEVLDKLKSWDYSYKANDYCPAVFDVFYNQFVELLVKDEIGDSLFGNFSADKIIYRNLFHNVWTAKNSPLCDNCFTPKNETFTDLVIEAYKSTLIKLTNEFGENIKDWEWGKIHTLTLEHPIGSVKILDKVFRLNRGPFPVGGSFHTVAPYSYKFSKPYKATSGASQRHIYNLANWDNSWTVIPTGNSGIASSPHYCDQTKLYLLGKYHPDVFSNESAQRIKRYLMVYEP